MGKERYHECGTGLVFLFWNKELFNQSMLNCLIKHTSTGLKIKKKMLNLYLVAISTSLLLWVFWLEFQNENFPVKKGNLKTGTETEE